MPIPSSDLYSQKAIDISCETVRDLGSCTYCDRKPSLCGIAQNIVERITKAYEPERAQSPPSRTISVNEFLASADKDNRAIYAEPVLAQSQPKSTEDRLAKHTPSPEFGMAMRQILEQGL